MCRTKVAVDRVQPYITAKCEIHEQSSSSSSSEEEEKLAESVCTQLLSHIKSKNALPAESFELLEGILKRERPSHLPEFAATLFLLPNRDKLRILQAFDVKERLQIVDKILANYELKFFFNRMRFIPDKSDTRNTRNNSGTRENNSTNSTTNSTTNSSKNNDEIFERLKQANLPPKVQQAAEREASRLKSVSPWQAEHYIIRNYLEWILDLPWQTATNDSIDLQATRQQLDKGK